jgi:hypothetical protein
MAEEINEIIKEFGNKVIKRRKEFFFKPDDAIAFIERCRELRKIIIGIEAFQIIDQFIQPMDYISYNSLVYDEFDKKQYFEKYHVEKNSDAGHWQEAIRFVQDRMINGWVFTFTYK